MELFAEIRREYQFGVGTIKGVARKLGVHRRVVRQALADAVPPARTYRARATPTLDRVQRLHRSRSWRPTGRRRGSSGTRRGGSTIGCRRSGRRRRSRRRRCGEYVRAWKQAAGAARPDGVRAADVRLGPGGAGRLVRSGRDPRRRGGDAAGVLPAEHGERRGVPPRLSARDAAGVSRSARGRVSRTSAACSRPLRYDNLTSAVRKILRGYPARGDDAVPGVSLALAVRRDVLHARRRA